MTFPMHPYLVGAIADAIDRRFGAIARHASDASGGDLRRQRDIGMTLIQEDLANPSPADRAKIEFVCDMAKATSAEWWRQGRRIINQGQLSDHDLATGISFIRLEAPRTTFDERGRELAIEGAFLTIEDSDGRPSIGLTALLSMELEKDVLRMTLEELTTHQSNFVAFAWDETTQRLVTAFSGRNGISDAEVLDIVVADLWNELSSSLGQERAAVRSVGMSKSW